MRQLLLVTLLYMVCGLCQAQVVTGDNIPAKADTAGALQKLEQAKEAIARAKEKILEAKMEYRRTGDNLMLIEAEGEYRIAEGKLERVRKLARVAKLDALPTRRILFGIDNALWSPTFSVEGRLHKYITMGALLKIKFIYHRGAKLEPFLRVYPSGRAPSGAFIQVKGSIGLYHTQILTPENIRFGEKIGGHPFNYSIRLPYTMFWGYGVGAAGGYQKLIGHNKHGFVEVFGGIQIIKTTLDFPDGFAVQHAAVMCPLEIGIRLGGAF